jgi:sec-independent protein translocase protein TatA
MFRNGLQTWHVIVVLVVILLLFGANRLPGLAKSIGESLKIFKKEIKDLGDDGTTSSSPDAPAPGTGPGTTTPQPPADGTHIPGMIDPNHPKA